MHPSGQYISNYIALDMLNTRYFENKKVGAGLNPTCGNLLFMVNLKLTTWNNKLAV